MKNKAFFLIIFVSFQFFQSFVLHADSTGMIDISGIWENKPYGRHFNKGVFSWGENVYSTSSVIIDLGSTRPRLSYHGSGSFYISEAEYRDGKVELTGSYSDKPNETKKIIVHIINRDTISIELIDRGSNWLPLSPGSENRFYRVPRDAPYEPLGPEGI